MKRFAIIGLGRFGRRLASSLTEHGHEVIAIDMRQQMIEEVRDEVALAVRLDATDAASLKSQGIEKVDAAIVTIGEQFEANALATATLKELGIRLVISRASTPIQSKILHRIGADQVISPEDESAVRLGRQLSNPHIMEFVELSEGHSLMQVKAPKPFHNKTLAQIDLRKKYKVNLVAIKKQVSAVRAQGEETVEEQVIDVPMADTVIRPDDILVLVGATENLARLPQ
ncbi:MAG: NAD(P)-binding domain-containing protein [Anaerolineaceae bacterium]|nr:NAD(P)-binding domain-containing protein [Anaerolineaceae bacterium]